MLNPLNSKGPTHKTARKNLGGNHTQNACHASTVNLYTDVKHVHYTRSNIICSDKYDLKAELRQYFIKQKPQTIAQRTEFIIKLYNADKN